MTYTLSVKTLGGNIDLKVTVTNVPEKTDSSSDTSTVTETSNNGKNSCNGVMAGSTLLAMVGILAACGFVKTKKRG